MIIYRGYYYFRKGEGKILIGPANAEIRGSLMSISSTNPRQFIITINRDDNIEEQIKTVLHEFSHIGLEYDGKGSPSIDWPQETEARIEQEAIQFYERNPPLVAHVRKTLRKKEKAIMF